MEGSETRQGEGGESPSVNSPNTSSISSRKQRKATLISDTPAPDSIRAAMDCHPPHHWVSTNLLIC